MMSADAAEEKLSDLVAKYKVLVVLVGGRFKRFSFYAEKRFNGKALNNYIAFLDDPRKAFAFSMVVERRGGEMFMIEIGGKELEALIAMCNSHRFLYSDMLVRVFKRFGLAIPKTVDLLTPVALFTSSRWREFEVYELDALKRYCRDVAHFTAKPMRLKDYSYIRKLEFVYRADKRILSALEKSGVTIREILSQYSLPETHKPS